MKIVLTEEQVFIAIETYLEAKEGVSVEVQEVEDAGDGYLVNVMVKR